MGKGGSERVLSLLVSKMSSHGHKVVIYQLIDDEVSYDLPDDVIRKFIRKSPIKFLNLYYWIMSIRKALHQTDVVISFAYKINVLVFIAKIGIKLDRVIFCERNHPRYDGRSKMEIALCNYIYKRVDHFVVQTKSIQQVFDGDVIKNSLVVPNPIKNTLDFDYQSNSNRIIAIGRLTEQKNFSLLIEAFDVVLQKLPELELLIFGEGPLRNRLQNEINVKRLEKNIKLVGITDQMFHEFSAASMFVQSSFYEGQSNALIEVMVHGIPVISMYYDGVEEVIQHGQNGLICYGTYKDLADMIIELIKDEDKRIKLGSNAIKLADDFDLDKIYFLWENLF